MYQCSKKLLNESKNSVHFIKIKIFERNQSSKILMIHETIKKFYNLL